MSDEVKHPLHDQDAEQSLLGLLLRDPAKNVAVAREIVAASDFYDPLHEAIAELIYQFDEDGKAISPITLNAWLKHNPAVKEIDAPPGREGEYYTLELVRYAAAQAYGSGAADLAMLIRDFAERRKAVAAMHEAEAQIAAHDRLTPQPLMPALEIVVRVADEISDRQQAAAGQTDAADHGDSLMHQISQQAQQQTEFGIRTNLGELDEVLGGLYPESLVVIGGRPGMGKSILGGALCRQAALQGAPADWWSIEMPGRECVARLLCDEDYDMAINERLKPMHYEDLVKMRATTGQMERSALANGRLRTLPAPLAVLAQNRVRMSQIAAVSRARSSRRPGVRLIVIDHLHILLPEDRYRGRRVDELSEITGSAKSLAKRTGACVVLLSQLSRDVEKRDDKRPFMSDFRDSGSIEQDADVVMALYRPEYYAEAAYKAAKDTAQRDKVLQQYGDYQNVLEIGVLKQRSGSTRSVSCFIDAPASTVRAARPVPEIASQLALDSR